MLASSLGARHMLCRYALVKQPVLVVMAPVQL